MTPQPGACPSVYLDHQASTPLDPQVFEAMKPWYLDDYGNPHAGEHAFGWRAHAAVEHARVQIADLIGAQPEELVFTSGATEANNLAIIGAARRAGPHRREILVSTIEHQAILRPAFALKDEGFAIRTIPVTSDGFVRLDAIEECLSDRVALVSIGAVNNEIGTVQPIERIGELCRRFGVLLHSDGAQALMASRFRLSEMPVDLMSFSAHKIYGPKGVGALYVSSRAREQIEPLMHGGGQEFGLRPGTLPTALCVGFGESADYLNRSFESIRNHLLTMSSYLLQGMRRLRPAIQLNGAPAPRHPGNINVRIPGVDAADLIQRLQPSVACSTGSACNAGSIEPSHVLLALGLSVRDANASLRMSVGRITTQTQIDFVISRFGQCLADALAVATTGSQTNASSDRVVAV